MVYPDNGILFSPKRNELSNYEKTWKNLKCILLSGRSQSEKATYCVIPTIQHSGNGKTGDRSVTAWGRGHKG